MKIYTKSGDQGETGLLGGVRVSKNNLAVCACGELDETNSQIGMALSLGLTNEIENALVQIQQDLFVLGSQVAECHSDSNRAAVLRADSVGWLESQIDQVSEGLPEMDAFILPGGISAAAQLHVARSVCRRAERVMVKLQNQEGMKKDISQIVVYLNRLGDLLFVMARRVNFVNDCEETRWLPAKP